MIFRNAGLVLAVLAVSAVSAAGADATLRWKFSKDKTYRYVLTQGMEMSMKLPDKDVTTKMSQVSEMTWKVKAVKSDGSAEISQTFDRIHIKVEGPAGAFEVDSKKKGAAVPDGPLAALSTMVEQLVGLQFDLVMSARGEMSLINVPDKFMEAMKTAGPGGQAFAGTFSEKGLKQLFEQSSMLLPEKAVSPGTTWVQKRSVEAAGLGGSMDGRHDLHRQGRRPGQDGACKIDGVVTMQFRAPENAPVW